MQIRPYRTEDSEALREICLLTGDHGNDASPTCSHPQLLSDYYAIPYAISDPTLCLVLVDESGPCGYIVGTADSRSFYEWFNTSWLPSIRSKYRNVSRTETASDKWLLERLGKDARSPTCVDEYPAHLHIDLLPRGQGGGWGRRLFEAWVNLVFQKGVPGIHLGVSKNNPNALGFYQRMGMTKIDEVDTAWLMGIKRPTANVT